MRRIGIWAVMICLAAGAAPAGAAILSGRVTNERGEGIFDVDLDFFVVSTGDEFEATLDHTDLNGFYSVAVPNEAYNVVYDAAVGSRYAGHEARNINLNVNRTLNIVLRDAWLVSGTVLRGDTGLPVPNVDLDAKDLSTGLTVRTSSDNTDVNGAYVIKLPIGVYEISYDGRPVALLAPVGLREISVTGQGDLALETVTLPPAFTVEVELLDDKGDSIPGADLDFLLPGTSTEIYLEGDKTDSTGKAKVHVVPGAYHVEFDPPAGSLSIAGVQASVLVNTSINLGVIVLPEGWLVSGVVRDPDGFPVRQAFLDFSVSASGAPVPTAQDFTNSSGQFGVRVPNGSFSIAFEPRLNSLADDLTRPIGTVASDRTLTDTILPFHDGDGDAAPDAHDNCAFVSQAGQTDGDADGVGDPCDNCAAVANPRQENNDADGPGDACDPDDDNDGEPDVADLDEDGDGVLDGPDNCLQQQNPNQEDRNANGAGDACDPGDGEVEALKARSASAFAWRPEDGAVTYQVYRQRNVWISAVNYGTCFRDDLRAPIFRDTDVPPLGEAFSYLVTVRTAAGEGTLGRRSDGVERPNLRACP